MRGSPARRCALAAAVLAASGFVRAAENADDMRRAALRGLKGCLVVAMSVKEGTSSEKVRAAALAHLREARIPVYENYEAMKSVPGKPTLTILLGDFVSVRLAQEVILKRDRSISTVAETWSSNCVVTGRPVPTDALTACLDEFIRDFRAANPRRARRK